MKLKVFSARELTGRASAVRGVRRFIRNVAPMDAPGARTLLRIDRKQWRPVDFLVVSSSQPVTSVLIVRDGREPVEVVKPKARPKSWHVFRAD